MESTPYANLGTLYYFQHRLVDAAEMYKLALKFEDHDCRVWGSLGAVYRLIPGWGAAADSAYHQAIALAQGRLQVNPNDPVQLALLAQYYAEVDQTIAARETARCALEAGPSRPDVLVFVSAAFEILGDRTAALPDPTPSGSRHPVPGWRRSQRHPTNDFRPRTSHAG